VNPFSLVVIDQISRGLNGKKVFLHLAFFKIASRVELVQKGVLNNVGLHHTKQALNNCLLRGQSVFVCAYILILFQLES